LEVMRAIDVQKLAHDRLQLIGEAARRLSQGESVVLDEALWGDAGLEQERRRVKDPWEDVLENIPVWHKVIKGYDENDHPIERTFLIIHAESELEIVAAGDLMKHLLDISAAHQTPATAMRLSTVMKQLGWSRYTNGNVTIRGVRQKGYFRRQAKVEGSRF
jgi:hypothetical protein